MTSRRILAAALAVAGALGAQGPVDYPDVYYFKFNEGSGDQIVNYATANGSAFLPAFQNLGLTSWVAGAPALGGTAWDVAGLTRLFGSGNGAVTGSTPITQSFTIEMWVRTNYTGTSIGRLFGDYSTGLFRCYLGFYNVGANYLGGGFFGTPYPLNNSTATVTDGNWHHIAWVYDVGPAAGQGTMATYVDGILDQASVMVGGSAAGTTFQLGGVVGVNPIFNGVVDDFRWYGQARTQAQILLDMNTEPVGPPIHAHFRGSRRTGSTPLLVSFTDFSETIDPNGITSWAWDVNGDGLTDYTVQNPCHAYTVPGIYNVTLTVTDGIGNSNTLTIPGYVNAGNPDFTFATCGNADLYLGAPPPPAGWSDGFTLVSTTTTAPVGFGWFFGLYPDGLTFAGLFNPPVPGNPLHFVNNGNMNIYPYTPFVLPPGSAAPLVGFTLDAVVVYRDPVGALLSFTSVSRVTF